MVLCIILIGNSAVIAGLWLAHFVWTYYCVARYASLESISLVMYPTTGFISPIPFLMVYASLTSMALSFQKQEAWTCIKDSSAGITASAARPLACRWSCSKPFRWDWIWVFLSPSCNI